MKALIFLIALISTTTFASVEGRWVGSFKVYHKSSFGDEYFYVRSGHVNIAFPRDNSILFIKQSFGYGFYILDLSGPMYKTQGTEIVFNDKTVGRFSESVVDFSIPKKYGDIECTENLKVHEAADEDYHSNSEALLYSLRKECTNGYIVEISGNLFLDPIGMH